MSRTKTSVKDIPEELLFFSKSDKFLNVYLVKQAGKSDYTRKSYNSSLLAFFDYVATVRKISPMKF
ncbi:MAG: hypothetical protein LUD47_07185, partial [Clostridia bacterium]|nr:hypothetical protein [Clostridia bacterium]